MARAFAALVLAILISGPASAQPAEPAGTVNRLKGVATATRGTISVALSHGTVILVGDRVSTGDDTRLRLNLISGATITLGDNSFIVVEAQEAIRGGQSVLEFFQGVFLAVTATVTDAPSPDEPPPDQTPQDPMIIRTPSAVLGIRGTTVWAEQQPDHLGVIMLAGKSVAVAAPGGTVVLSAPLLGTDVRSGQPPTDPKRWGQKRIDAANRSVAFE